MLLKRTSGAASPLEDAPDWPVLLLSLMMVVVPTMGVPSEELLQDSLKSILVAFFTLGAAFMFFYALRAGQSVIDLHWTMLLPASLMLYASASMMWSHTYLAGVETVRWFLLTAIVFIGVNTLTLQRVSRLAWGIHIGATLACLWAAAQFWFDFGLFPQGPAPASTFVNRNFFAEFVVCSLPFSVLLISQIKKNLLASAIVTVSFSFNISALLMTGTRSALVALMALLVLFLITLWIFQSHVVKGGSTKRLLVLTAFFLATLFTFSSIHTSNASLISEGSSDNALQRSLHRTLSIGTKVEYTQGSMSTRFAMWQATLRMIQANPLAGVGAGAWEVHVPQYQEATLPLEIDYYAHNDFLQLIGEYGAVGWAFLVGLSIYLLSAAWRTWEIWSVEQADEALVRTLALSSLLALSVVASFGFPLKLASTCAMFALCLAVLVASDIRINAAIQPPGHFSIAWSLTYRSWTLACMVSLTGLAIFLTAESVICESKLTRAVKIGLTISQSRDSNSPHWTSAKAQMVQWANEGIAINPHYRKLTPSVADALASWGDWSTAVKIWGSVAESRPFVFGILTNLARGEAFSGHLDKAQAYLDRAKKLQPDSPAIGTLEVFLASRTTDRQTTASQAKKLLLSENFDFELTRLAYAWGMENKDHQLAILALESRMKKWPALSLDSWIKLGHVYELEGVDDEALARKSYCNALGLSDQQHRQDVIQAIPAAFISQCGL